MTRLFFFCVFPMVLLILDVTNSTPTIIKLRINDECYRDKDCEASIENSQCHLGYCRCRPFFAVHNGTRCVESTLLGNDCLVPEQCYLKVANSSCLDGVCRCEEGHLQFRRHTCLKAAKPGEVCYSHEHCRLWDSDTHCDFLIPDLFGRCQCSAPMKRDGEICRPDLLVLPPMASTQSSFIDNFFDDKNSSALYINEPEDEFDQINPEGNSTETGVQISWLKNATRLLSTPQRLTSNLVTRPMYRTPKPYNENTNELPDDSDSIIIEADEITELIQTTTSTTSTPTKADRHESITLTPVSLGLTCNNDLECRMADTNSRCINGICDCKISGGNNTCGARRTGCPVGTFQCRGSGVCISWFFICDGRRDCGDGSDEECSHGQCPHQSFHCKKSDTCISRAGQCDGRIDCPNGEDEEGCKNRRKCPDGAYRCNNGQCLPAYEFCNAVVSCRDGSDEPRGACRTRYRSRITPARNCPFRCANGQCRSDAITCSGRDGCGDGSDEINCNVCRCPAIL
ncbi:hypothetical protein PV328_008866 [Microctonus aethiopoides]|uniref:EB domain-containing protein n=1 Tax=Microctonus aethiopoides TaxID=144406 RepID=A0AA39FK63_9HYME|nr:hypothetical protein PV328_008866 [Microctonus aethiopoides]